MQAQLCQCCNLRCKAHCATETLQDLSAGTQAITVSGNAAQRCCSSGASRSSWFRQAGTTNVVNGRDSTLVVDTSDAAVVQRYAACSCERGQVNTYNLEGTMRSNVKRTSSSSDEVLFVKTMIHMGRAVRQAQRHGCTTARALGAYQHEARCPLIVTCLHKPEKLCCLSTAAC